MITTLISLIIIPSVFCQYNYGYNPYQQAYGGRPGYVAQWPQRQYNQYNQISNQGSSNDWVLTGVRSLRPEQGALVKPGFVNRYNPPVSRPEYNQYSKPGYNQYSKPEYNQYNRPGYNQYSRPNYNQYSKPGYNQYNPEYNQYDRRVDMSYLAPYYENPRYVDPRFVPEVNVRCEPKNCYKICRLKLMGGGRCTKAGCLCYAGFFDYDGSPINTVYPEDNLWWSLTSAEQNEIRREMAKFSVNNSQNNVNPSRPDYNQDDNPGGQGGYNPSRPVTSRPPYNPGGQGGFNPSRPVTSRPPYNRPTARPPYKPQTTQRSYISEDSWKTTERSYIAEDSWNNEGSGFDDDEGDSWDDDDPFGSDDEDDDDGWGNFGRK